MTAEVEEEIEAMKAVYGSDCRFIGEFPPHLHLLIKPRTADDISQQFVEAIIGINANDKYPLEPPVVEIVDSKGLDVTRQEHLIRSVQIKAKEFSSMPMLISLCEEAVEILSSMNHPDGNCPLCLDTLYSDGAQGSFLPFMKLMSCFHCFHSKCIVRWWEWLQHEIKNDNLSDSRGRTSEPSNQLLGNCPVCRKDFVANDIEHVLDLLKRGSQMTDNEELNIDTEILDSEYENLRRQTYGATLAKQRESGGLIEPKRLETLLPGMFLPEPLTAKAGALEGQTSDISLETVSDNGRGKPSTSEHRSLSMRKKNWNYNQRRHWNSKPSGKYWVKKEKDTP